MLSVLVTHPFLSLDLSVWCFPCRPNSWGFPLPMSISLHRFFLEPFSRASSVGPLLRLEPLYCFCFCWFFFYSLVLGSVQMSERMIEHLLLFAKPKKEHGKGINCFKSPWWSGIIWCITENTWWRKLFSLFVFGWLWPREARWIAQDKFSLPFFLSFLLSSGSHSLVNTVLGHLLMFLTQPPKRWNCRHRLLCPALLI